MNRLIPILILAALLAACSGKDSPADRGSEEAAVRDAVSTYVVAFGDGNPDRAWAFVSERCQDSIPESEYRAGVAAAGELYADLKVDEFTEIVLDGDTAVVAYTTDPVVEGAKDDERWIQEAGTWRWDDC